LPSKIDPRRIAGVLKIGTTPPAREVDNRDRSKKVRVKKGGKKKGGTSSINECGSRGVEELNPVSKCGKQKKRTNHQRERVTAKRELNKPSRESGRSPRSMSLL